MKDYQDNIIETHKGKLVSKIVKMSMDIEVPESPRDENGIIIDSNFSFKYYRKHYWDNVDLTDDALVNNPVFHNKLEYFFGERMMVQHWDSIIAFAFPFVISLFPIVECLNTVLVGLLQTLEKVRSWAWIRCTCKC